MGDTFNTEPTLQWILAFHYLKFQVHWDPETNDMAWFSLMETSSDPDFVKNCQYFFYDYKTLLYTFTNIPPNMQQYLDCFVCVNDNGVFKFLLTVSADRTASSEELWNRNSYRPSLFQFHIEVLVLRARSLSSIVGGKLKTCKITTRIRKPFESHSTQHLLKHSRDNMSIINSQRDIQSSMTLSKSHSPLIPQLSRFANHSADHWQNLSQVNREFTTAQNRSMRIWLATLLGM